jgi:hypothetical protein
LLRGSQPGQGGRGQAGEPDAFPGQVGLVGVARLGRQGGQVEDGRPGVDAGDDDATVNAHLDHLAQGQLDDGGWTFNWPAWSPAAERDWRGFLTVDALRVLRANNRL